MSHSTVPVSVAAFPLAHFVQLLALAVEYLPIGQKSQEVVVEKVPAEHGRHCVVPITCVAVPSGQILQVLTPPLLNLPTSHARQSASNAYRPAEHAAQAVAPGLDVSPSGQA